MKVKATRRGFYGGLIREPGVEFEITSKKELGSWMQLLPKPRKVAVKKAVSEEEHPDS